MSQTFLGGALTLAGDQWLTGQPVGVCLRKLEYGLIAITIENVDRKVCDYGAHAAYSMSFQINHAAAQRRADELNAQLARTGSFD